ncbi:MAG: phosphoribosylglycinamide formyltransferase [Actinobacteria bacterium]|nr:phosphoribosylglycinamide formyltransferase [Actinomycetota bacterium]
MRIAVLASGNGSNLQAIIDAIGEGALTGVVLALVLSDKPGCRALERAVEAGVATGVFELLTTPTSGVRAERDRAMIERLRAEQIDLVVLAGYMQILSAEFVQAFAGRLINVHPSLLPRFPGLDAIGQALDAGVAETGVTVHYVDEGVDTGPVIAQESLPIEPGDTADTLAERVHAIEHRLLPSVIVEIAAGRLTGH